MFPRIERERSAQWSWSGPVVAAALSMIWCAYYTRPLLNPFSLETVFRDDWAQHTLGWLFFRNERLSFPIGRLNNFLYPLGTTMSYMDAIPWVALSLRPFQKLIPPDFQYLGLWILLCSAALAFVAASLFRRLTEHWEQQALAGTLVAIAPTLVLRIGHPALCAHAMIVAALALCSIRSRSVAEARRHLALGLFVTLLAAATHPYLALMVIALALGIPIRTRSYVGTKVTLAALAFTVAGPLLIFSLLGYFDGRNESTIGGFGSYSANLNTFINGMGHSRIFAPLPTAPEQYEGYAYVGAGVLLCVAIGLASLSVRSMRERVLSLPWRRVRWLLFASCCCAGYAFATPWRWGDMELFHIRAYSGIEPLTHSLRSSGRFVWPLLYCLVCGSLAGLISALRFSRPILTSVLLALVGLQLYDIDPSDAWARYQSPPMRFLRAPEWAHGDHTIKHLVLYPAEIRDACDGPEHYRSTPVNELAYLAYRHRWTFNSGYTSRVPQGIRDSCSDLRARVAGGDLRSDELYIVWQKDLGTFRRAGAVCGQIDGVLACVRSNSPSDRLAAYLLDHPEPKHRKRVRR